MTASESALERKLGAMEERFEELSRELATPEVVTDYAQLRTIGQEQAALEPAVRRFQEYRRLGEDLEAARQLLQEAPGSESLALKEEVEQLEQRRALILAGLAEALRPRDPNDDRDVIVEIRAGTGGEEASLFAADLFRLYERYAEDKGWRVELISANRTDLGGLKEVVFEVIGKGAYSKLKFESGVHRVQRVPSTEASGRIHTSTATVAVFPEPEDVEVNVREEDLRVDVYRSTGHGGQSVNTTDSAVRITHLPTGLVVTCQDEKSQLKNKVRALTVLKARLYDMELRRQHEEVDQTRRAQVGSGERAEKIRTYNFPQNRVTDHRIDLTLYNLESMLQGDLDPLISSLALAARREAGLE